MRPSQEYIQALQKKKEPSACVQMETDAIANNVPIMEKDGIAFLKQILRIHRPKKILEIGSAIGYSAIQMALVDPSIEITTLEIDETRYQAAKSNVQNMGMEKQIDVVHQDALDYLLDLSQDTVFDFVLVDAAKGKNKAFVESVNPFLNKGGLIAIDNVLFKGYVSGENKDSKRMVKLASKIDAFNQWLIEQEQFETTIVETGDGITLAIKVTD